MGYFETSILYEEISPQNTQSQHPSYAQPYRPDSEHGYKSSWFLHPCVRVILALSICEIMGVPPEKMQSAESISKVFWEGVWSAAAVEAFWAVAGVALAPFTFGISLAVTAYGTYQEWNESQKRVLVLGEALIQWIKSGYPNIGDGKAYLDKIRKKLESGNL